MSAKSRKPPADASPVQRLQATPSYKDLVKAWKTAGKTPLHWGGLWGSAKACLSAAFASQAKVPQLIVVPDGPSAELALDDLAAFGCGAAMLPARESRLGAEPEVLRERFHALDLATRKGFTGTLIAPLHALIQPVPAAADAQAEIYLEQGMQLDPDALMSKLVATGFERVPAIQESGEFARRGDILDLFAPAMGEPLRLEFFDDELESIRVFDLGSQRTRHILRTVRVPLAHDLAPVGGADDTLPLERFPAKLRVVLWEPSSIDEARERLRFLGPEAVNALNRVDEHLRVRPQLQLAALPGRDGSLTTLSVEEYCQGVVAGAGLLAERANDGETAVVLCATDAEADRLRQILGDSGHASDAMRLQKGGLDRGFRIPEARLTVLHHREFVPGHGSHRPRARHIRDHASVAVENIVSLRPGDLVVHAVHGLAEFRGIESAQKEGGQDLLLLEFEGEASLSVPVSRVDLVERYIGAGGDAPKLDKMGSGSFERRRLKVAEAVEDLAAEMLEVQAKRAAMPGRAMPEPAEAQRAFEAAFPWEDTPDQAQGTREIHADLSIPRAMDRLLCGDVGYGKTELAARAAFRAIEANTQVAILVPTTVLCEQHTRSLRQRFADWPIRVEQLSRLTRPADQRAIIEGLGDGSVDLVVGTHRLLSRDVQFGELGLVIIDEEQRFGVRHKEELKKKRALVDVLSLSATPVPRTLHMAMAGLRDITTLSTAPAGRLEVHTELRYADERDFIAELLQRELARGGQSFFVHNRIKTLETVKAKLQNMVPQAKIVTAHGQMDPRGLEKAMLEFVRGDIDILVSTTIIESGLDIPNANTIFIDDAHRYGLADMHQLRGRVGRADRRGYCTLLIPRGQPLPNDARRRLKAVEELRYLGAGFQIAMRDLEIRGAGNLLGAEQSGHIHAVGYETYRRLLHHAVTRLKREGEVNAAREDGVEAVADISLGVPAALSAEYVPDEEARLSVLREFDRVRTPEQLETALTGVRDRFGPPDEGVRRLAQLFYLKYRLGALGLAGVQRVEGHLLLKLRDAKLLEKSLKPLKVDLRVITPRRAHWVLPNPEAAPTETLDYLYTSAVACRLPGKQGQSAARARRG
jgi:transcription-repair coupling factor (superfamily II helicase)